MKQILLAFLIVSGIGSTAHASRTLRFEVPATGGVYDVPVHPDFLTVFYFPAPVQNAYAQNQSEFTLLKSRTEITIKPQPEAKGATNLLAECELFRVGVVLRVVSNPEDAAISVEFRSLDVEQAFRQRVAEEVERELAPRLEKLKVDSDTLQQQKHELEQIILFRARQRMLDFMARRHTHVDVGEIARSRDHVIVRVHRLIWLGDDAYLDFEIQNRSEHPYELGVQLRYGKDLLASTVALVRDTYVGRVPVIAAGARERGLVSVPSAARWMGRSVVMTVSDAHDHSRVIRVRLQLLE